MINSIEADKMLKEVRRAISLVPKNVVYLAKKITDFDRLYGTDTTQRAGPDELGITSDYVEHGYEATPARFFRRAVRMGKFPIEGTTFIDIGVGKGLTLMLASRLPFERIIGVELSPLLCDIARENLRIYKSVRQRCRAMEVVCADALEYRWPDGPLVLYMYNPFSANVMAKVMASVADSIRRAPRPVSVVYFNPVQRAVLDALPWLKLVRYRQFNSLIRQYPLCRVAVYKAI